MASKLLHLDNRDKRISSGETSKQFKIFLVEDHTLMREGLRRLLQDEPGLTICGESETARNAFLALKRTDPDLVLVDISLPDIDGLELIKNLKTHFPDLRMIVLSMHAEELYARRALKAGAIGYVMKNAPLEQFREAIHSALNNKVYLSPKLSSQLLDSLASPKKRSSFDELTDRELEVLRRIGEGLDTGEIAKSLMISAKTVETHRGNIRRKLQLHSGSELIQFALLNRNEF